MKKTIALLCIMLCTFAAAQENADSGYMYIYHNDKSIDRIPIAQIDSVTFVDSGQAESFGLPKVYITTPGGTAITSKTAWLEECTIRIIDEYGIENLNMNTSIRGRGNTTWTYPKKPYAIKLNSKAGVLGMPKHKRWVLLANWMDRTLLRNDVSFEMARRIMDWAPRGRFVELYLNDEHQGNYYLCEHIKVDDNRVNIDEIDEKTDLSNEQHLTGGYILEYDKNTPNDEMNYFYTTVLNLPVAIKEPDEDVITSWSHPGFLYIKGYINNLEQIFEDDKSNLARWDEISELIDVESYIDWWLVHELTFNAEVLHPKSSYMYKKRNGKLYAGPVWDFDYGTFRSNASGILVTPAMYYRYMFRYPEFRTAVKERWAEVKDILAGIDDYILEQAGLISASSDVNIAMWPITQLVNGDEKMTFAEAVESMRSVLKNRMRIVEDFILAL